MTVMMEANIDRAFRFAVRNHQDELAADIAFDHTGRHVNDQFRQALLLISQIMPFERQPGASYDRLDLVLAVAYAERARADHEWSDCLASAERGLELATVRDKTEEFVELCCAKAFALSRLNRREAAVSALQQAAARVAGSGQRDRVVSDLIDITEYLHIPPDLARAAKRQVTGAFPAAFSVPIDEAQSTRAKLETVDYWESELRGALIRGDRGRATQAQIELGRLLGLAGETAQADTLLRAVLSSQTRDKFAAANIQYYLGLTWEVGDDFEQAERWLRGALQAFSSNDEKFRLTADCIYELGIVMIRSGRYDEALPVFRSARERYQEIGQAGYAADALYMAAQATYAAGTGTGIGPVEDMLVEALAEPTMTADAAVHAREMLDELRSMDR